MSRTRSRFEKIPEIVEPEVGSGTDENLEEEEEITEDDVARDMVEKKKFRVQSKSFFLTYKTHIDKEKLCEFLCGLKPKLVCERFIAAHETADEKNPYFHTHVYIKFSGKFDSEQCRIFDFPTEGGAIHPNIKIPYGTITKMLKYLAKEDPANIHLLKEAGGAFIGNRVSDFTSEKELLCGIEMKPTDVSGYLKAFHIMKTQEEKFTHQYPLENFSEPLMDWDFKCVFLQGSSGWGKTQWALWHFSNPLLVGHLDELRKFKKDVHDGIVFDDMSLKHLPRETVIQIVDWDEDRAIHGRNVNAHIPKHTKKIFVTNKNWDEYMPEDSFGAIRRRFSDIIICEGSLLKDNITVSTEPIVRKIGGKK